MNFDFYKNLFVDVDGTLLLWRPKEGSVPRGILAYELANHCAVNKPLVAALNSWLIADTGRQLVIWTTGGKKHAEFAAALCGLHSAVCLRKPDGIIDDHPGKHLRHAVLFDALGNLCAGIC